MNRCVIAALGCLAGGTLSQAAFAGEVVPSICVESTRMMNSLVDFAKTECVVPGQGEPTLIFATASPVFAVEAARKPYLLVWVASIGDAMNNDPQASVPREATIADASLSAKRQYFAIPTAVAAQLQRDVKSNRINLDQMYAAILKAGQTRQLPAKR